MTNQRHDGLTKGNMQSDRFNPGSRQKYVKIVLLMGEWAQFITGLYFLLEVDSAVKTDSGS